jgi:hypothetical protein
MQAVVVAVVEVGAVETSALSRHQQPLRLPLPRLLVSL